MLGGVFAVLDHLIDYLCRAVTHGSFGIGQFVLAYQMLDEIVLAIALVRAIVVCTAPPLKLSVSLALMAYPVGLAFERLGFCASGERTREGLYILEDMLRPIGWFLDGFDLEAYRALELGW